MRARALVFVSMLALAPAAPATQAQQPASPPQTTQKPRQLVVADKPWTGDFHQMIERRMIRMLVPYSRTLYYNDKGRERGLIAELARDFERYINQKYQKELGKGPITVYLIPIARD